MCSDSAGDQSQREGERGSVCHDGMQLTSLASGIAPHCPEFLDAGFIQRAPQKCLADRRIPRHHDHGIDMVLPL